MMSYLSLIEEQRFLSLAIPLFCTSTSGFWGEAKKTDSLRIDLEEEESLVGQRSPTFLFEVPEHLGEKMREASDSWEVDGDGLFAEGGGIFV